jgi:hypothetical protein
LMPKRRRPTDSSSGGLLRLRASPTASAPSAPCSCRPRSRRPHCAPRRSPRA